jgi:hypothetical protein
VFSLRISREKSSRLAEIENKANKNKVLDGVHSTQSALESIHNALIGK